MKTTCPKPGLHRDADEQSYHSWVTSDGYPPASKSLLCNFYDSAAKAKHYIDHGSAEKQCFIDGRLFDTMLLEPDKRDERFAVIGVPDKKGNKWAVPKKMAKRSGLDAVTQKEYNNTMAMVFSVRRNPIAAELIDAAAYRQPSIVWPDKRYEVNGKPLVCKGRLDLVSVINGQTCHVDIKTSADPSPRAFEKAFASFHYNIQAAHYLHGCNVIAPMDGQRRFIFIVVGKSPEYGSQYRCEVYEYDPTTYERDLHERDQLLARYAKCLNSGEWPGREYGLNTVSAPDWAYSFSG